MEETTKQETKSCYCTAVIGAVVIVLAWWHVSLGAIAPMILGGMGPVNPLTSAGGKVFASACALFSGLVFIAVMGVVFSPLLHRMLHKFHTDDKDLQE